MNIIDTVRGVWDSKPWIEQKTSKVQNVGIFDSEAAMVASGTCTVCIRAAARWLFTDVTSEAHDFL